MANTAAGIILVAGGITFTNEWYQGHTINWRVPIATVLAAAVFDGLARLDEHAAVGLSVVVLIGAFVNKVNGKSIADVLNESFSKAVTTQRAKKAAVV